MPVNWKDPEAFTRLLAAMVAAQDMKLDYRKIASMYGNGATYDSIEGRFRIIKKEAATLKAEVDNGDRPEAPARGVASANVTPRKSKSAANTPKKDKTLGGRVGKTNGTPTKKRGNNVKGIKEEPESRYDTIPSQAKPIVFFVSETSTDDDGDFRSSSSFLELAGTEEDEGFAADVEGGFVAQGGGGEGGEFELYHDVEDSMDFGAF